MRTGLLGWLAHTPVILGFLVLTLLVGAGFWPVMQAIDGTLLDMISDGEDAIVRLNEMSPDQRSTHFNATVTLDVIYPIAYGGLLIGLLSRLAWSWRWVLICIPIIGMLSDYAENTIQAMALGGHDASILLAKTYVTPLKSGALVLTLGLCLVLGGAALLKKLSGKAKTNDNDKEPLA